MECQAGVCDSCHLHAEMRDYVLTGLEDGSLHLYNLSQNFGKSVTLPKQRASGSHSADPYQHFVESNFEHQDAIVSIERAPDSHTEVVSASRDGAVMLWAVEPLANQMEGEDVLRFIADQQIGEPLTKVKFISNSQILASTVLGNLYLLQISKDSQNVPFLDKPKLFF